MTLSLAEAAIALGESERQVHYLIKTGRLVAKKGEGGRWFIDSDALPLSDAQRQAMAERAATARQAVEKAIAPLEKAATPTTEETANTEKRPMAKMNDQDPLFPLPTGGQILPKPAVIPVLQRGGMLYIHGGERQDTRPSVRISQRCP
jgi:hypothetical protein